MSDDILVRLRRQADGGGGRMVVIPRADLVELLARVRPAATPTGGVTLTTAPRDVERLAQAAWDTATDPSHVERFGAWHDADDARRTHHRDAAHRTLTHLTATTE